MRRVVEDGQTFAQAAAWANVSKSTVHGWVTRWRRAAAAERASLVCLQERSSRPRRCPRRVPAEDERRICELRERTGWSPRRLADEPQVRRSHSTVHRVLQRAGISRRPRPERPAVVRYQWPCPGQLLHMDTKKLGKFEQPGHAVTGDRARRSRRVGWEFLHSIVDDCSRLAYSEIHDDEKAATVTAFTGRALDLSRVKIFRTVVCWSPSGTVGGWSVSRRASRLGERCRLGDQPRASPCPAPPIREENPSWPVRPSTLSTSS